MRGPHTAGGAACRPGPAPRPPGPAQDLGRAGGSPRLLSTQLGASGLAMAPHGPAHGPMALTGNGHRPTCAHALLGGFRASPKAPRRLWTAPWAAPPCPAAARGAAWKDGRMEGGGTDGATSPLKLSPERAARAGSAAAARTWDATCHLPRRRDVPPRPTGRPRARTLRATRARVDDGRPRCGPCMRREPDARLRQLSRGRASLGPPGVPASPRASAHLCSRFGSKRADFSRRRFHIQLIIHAF